MPSLPNARESVAEARTARDAAKKLLACDVDPSQSRKEQKRAARLSAENTFEIVAREWCENQKDGWTARYHDHVVRRPEAKEAVKEDGLLMLYLGEQQGNALARRLRDSGLIQHLRSGYDVRLVIDLANADSDGTKLPRDRIGLYRAAVAAAWPEGD